MKYEITIDFIVDSEITLCDTIRFEYRKAKNGKFTGMRCSLMKAG